MGSQQCFTALSENGVASNGTYFISLAIPCLKERHSTGTIRYDQICLPRSCPKLDEDVLGSKPWLSRMPAPACSQPFAEALETLPEQVFLHDNRIDF